ncbi:IS630 family transposase [Kitasatospora indigofera]|uniref:IS630 family transposase n=1 Tax=Kitasatospora indigofera TaxID=67307 RepID=UPI0033A3E653
MAYGHKTPYQLRRRAEMVLHAARGRSNARIARETGLHLDTVRAWRGRFADGGLPALADRKRSGRPARFTPMQVAEAKALACQLPAETGVPLSRWSCPELAAELTARGITDSVSASTVRRRLREDALKPWQYRSWILIRDPNFRAKAQRVLDLYARTFEGVPLGEDEYVLSSDEKTSIQARCRCRPALALGRARAMRVNHEYGRGGALAYLAAYDVHRTEVFGRCEPQTGIMPFMALVEQVMTQEPYAGAKRVFWVVDNGSSHRSQRAIDRLASRFSNAVMVHTPVHASWTNQIEIYFSIVQRKVVQPNDFTDLTQVRDRLRTFEARYNATAQPFQWKFTTSDLDDLLARLDRHTPADRQEESSDAHFRWWPPGPRPKPQSGARTPGMPSCRRQRCCCGRSLPG